MRSANAAFCDHFRVDPEEMIDKRIYDLGNRQWDTPALRRLLEEDLLDGSAFYDFELEHS